MWLFSVKHSGTVLFCLTRLRGYAVKQKRTVPECLIPNSIYYLYFFAQKLAIIENFLYLCAQAYYKLTT